MGDNHHEAAFDLFLTHLDRDQRGFAIGFGQIEIAIGIDFTRIVSRQERRKARVLAICELGFAGIEALNDLDLHWDGSELLFPKY